VSDINSIAQLFSSFAAVWQNAVRRMSGVELVIGKPVAAEVSRAEAEVKAPDRGVVVTVPVTVPAPGVNILYFPLPLAAIIPERIINPESEQTPAQFSDLHKSAFGELAGQAWSEAAAQLSTSLGRAFKTGKAVIALDSPGNLIRNLPAFVGIDRFVVIEYPVKSVYGAAKLVQLMPADFANALIVPAGERKKSEKPKVAPDGKKIQALDVKQLGADDAAARKRKAEKMPVEFARLPKGALRNINALLDVPVTLTAEIGRANITIEKLANLGPGSVFELDTDNGRPIRVLINGRVVALGSVITIGEKFGVRLVEIVEPEKRLEGI
jgi:flagellar motor switch protein FliN